MPAPDQHPQSTPASPEVSPHRQLGPSRRAMLFGAGAVAAGAVAGPAHAAGVPARAAAEQTAAWLDQVAIPSPGSLPLTGGPDLPIGLFWPPHPYASTPERFAEIAEAGFDFVLSGNYAGDGNIFQYQLGLARSAGLKMLISDDIQVRNMSRWFGISDRTTDPLTITPAEARELFTRARDAYGPYSSLAGFNLYDEPGAGWFGTLARATAVARELAPELLPYVNLLPSDDPAYYDAFVDTVKPSLVSFDRYPLLSEGREDANYFHNWAIVRAAALRAGVPAWVFVQTLAYDNHREPTAAELLWQVNISLAYGAKGIQYFTYWTPEAARGEGFGPALITTDGRRTARYHAAKKLNHDWLHPVGRQLKPLVSESVVHANETPPYGTQPFRPTDLITRVDGSAAVLGTFHSPDPATRDRWLLVANRSHQATARTTLTFDPTQVTGVDLFRPITARTTAHRGATVPLTLAPGAAQLLHLHVR